MADLAFTLKASVSGLEHDSGLEQAAVYLSRVVPVVEGAYINIHYTTVKLKPDGKPYLNGTAHTDVEGALNTVRRVMSRPHEYQNIYACLSAQAACEEKTSNGFSFKIAKRSAAQAVAFRSIFFDIDVKPDQPERAYPDSLTAKSALQRFITETGLPDPTLIVQSGTGGLHVYWCTNRNMSLEEWTQFARALAEAARHHGLKCDTQCTVNAAQILRVPGTLNYKTVPPRPVVLGGYPVQPDDYAVEDLQRALTPYMGAQALRLVANDNALSRAMGSWAADINDEFTGGIAEALQRPPVDLDSVGESCGFIRHTLTTGGADNANPLWNITTLLATFCMGSDGSDGRSQAHRMAAGHKDYDYATTDALYDRKLAEKEEKNIGWPSCQTIANLGCTSCASCSFSKMGKSPLNLGGERQAASTAAVPATLRKTLKAVGLAELPAKPHRREPVLGSLLVRSSVAVLTAPGGVGKTSLIVAIALSMCSGRNLLGMPVYRDERRGGLRVLFINAEDATREINLRIRAAMLHYGLSEEELGGLRIIGAEIFGLSLLTPGKAGSTINEEDWAALDNLIAEERPDVVILDPLYSVMGGASVNDNAVMGLFIGRLTALAARKNLSVLLAHHTGKGRDLSSQDASLGAVSIVNGARIVANLERLTIEMARKLSVPSWIAPSCFRLRFVKANLRAPDDEACLFRTIGVQIDNARPPVYPEGDRVGVVEVYRPEAAGPAFPPGMVRDALHAIGGAQPPLNPTPQARKHRACTAVAQAIAHHRGGQTDEIGAASLLAHLDSAGLVVSAEVMEQGEKSRTFKRKALVVTDAGNALLHSLPPLQDCGPASAGSPEHARDPESQGFPMSSQD
ncbi:AAA family ATPase [Methylobacterium oxalidis]|uniref:AAA family ATPase n=1 Tax=Methylobacterium oxalidis TaxID=944322 RepID=UPI003314DAB4